MADGHANETLTKPLPNVYSLQMRVKLELDEGQTCRALSLAL